MIFIIGGNGFVGSAIVRACHTAGRECAVITRDNYDLFRGRKCSILINANGNSKKFLSNEQPLLDFDLSVRSVRASLIDFESKFYVHLSSCDVYPDCSSPATTREDQPIDVSRQSRYGFHKLIAEECVRHASKKHLILRMGGFIGAGLKKNPIFDILNGGPLWLHPDSELQFLSSDVLAESVFQLIDGGVQNETFNICGQGTIRLADVIAAVGKPTQVKENAPRVRYEVSLESISDQIQLPETRATVLQFVRDSMSSQPIS